jgi:hypothetical protein
VASAQSARREEIVEPVFGQITAARGFRRFSLRGRFKVTGEWRLVCAVRNLDKLFRSGAAGRVILGLGRSGIRGAAERAVGLA